MLPSAATPRPCKQQMSGTKQHSVLRAALHYKCVILVRGLSSNKGPCKSSHVIACGSDALCPSALESSQARAFVCQHWLSKEAKVGNLKDLYQQKLLALQTGESVSVKSFASADQLTWRTAWQNASGLILAFLIAPAPQSFQWKAVMWKSLKSFSKSSLLNNAAVNRIRCLSDCNIQHKKST